VLYGKRCIILWNSEVGSHCRNNRNTPGENVQGSEKPLSSILKSLVVLKRENAPNFWKILVEENDIWDKEFCIRRTSYAIDRKISQWSI
jgi:hypothetical protein